MSRAARGLRGAGVLVAVAALGIAGALLSPEFLTAGNLVNAVRGVALLGIVATGVTFVTYGGHYADLSVPAVMATAGTTAVAMLPVGLVPALLAALGVGAVVGLVNGWAVGHLRVNPVIWTLAAGTVIEGVLRWTIGGRQLYPDASAAAGQQFLAVYGASVGPVPLVLVVLVGVGALGHLLLVRTRFGAELGLVGSAYEAARLAGIAAPRRVAASFLLASLAAALGGILLTSLNKVGAPYLGRGYDFTAVTAVVLGGVSLAGGRGSVPGALGGVLVIGLMANVLTLLGVGTFWQAVAQGVVFIAVVGGQQLALRRTGRDDA